MINNKKNYVLEIINILKKHFGVKLKCALNFSNPLELLVAVILSAQCTDERVNKITGELFNKYKTLDDYADANISSFAKDIKSAGFFRNKAKNIVKSANLIRDLYGGIVPDSMHQLIKLPGVARKTANVVLGSAYSKCEGIAVDTHVIRITNLLKLTTNVDPVKIENDLMKVVPKKYWINFSFYIQSLGRTICKARNPNHGICPLNKICPSATKIKA
ncbi:MAG: endonuclease III [Endomicrobium sp.]|jgi:endonuclease-3|nr:endonuclease III [Endomicrobium sp.]